MKKTEETLEDDGYQSVSCDLYSELELAIMHARRLSLRWRDGNVSFALPVTPTDLETAAGEEFLHARLPSGQLVRIRLDQIDRLDEI